MHTPGPWTFVESTDARIPDRITGPNDAPVARGSIGTNRADAVLIAAAPDLLNALVAVLPYINAPIGYTEQARAAISKAMGEI
jgi:hypothetical protein